MTHVRTKDATMHIYGPDDSGHYWLHLSASGETCRIDLGMPRGMIETALLMAASVKFGRPGGDYTLAPHLQKIVDGAKTAPQWDTQADRLAPTDAATQKGGDAHDRRLRSHEASPGVTAGADAAQAREAALREAHKAILAMDTKKDEDLTYNLAVLRAAEKVRRLIDEART